jgi:hypothetical protein
MTYLDALKALKARSIPQTAPPLPTKLTIHNSVSSAGAAPGPSGAPHVPPSSGVTESPDAPCQCGSRYFWFMEIWSCFDCHPPAEELAPGYKTLTLSDEWDNR